MNNQPVVKKYRYTSEFIATLAANGIHETDANFQDKAEQFNAEIIKAEVAKDEKMYHSNLPPTYSYPSEWEMRGSRTGE